MAKFRILALDGGGIRGLLTTRILKRLSSEPKLAGVFESIDLIAGTSSGGLIALAMSAGRQQKVPMAAALGELEKLFEEGREAFGRARPWWRGGYFFRSKYPHNHREQLIRKMLGNTTLGDLEQKVLIAAFDLDNEGRSNGKPDSQKWKPKLFHNMEGERYDCKIPIWKVAMYTTALPVFFPSVDGYIDGGVFANNPTMCALAQALDGRYGREPKPALGDISVLSLGSGLNLNSLPRDAWRWRRYLRPLLWRTPEDDRRKPLNWGALPWGIHVVDLIVDGTNGIADYEATQLLGPNNYRRICPEFEPDVHINTDGLDRVEELKEAADEPLLVLDKDIEWILAHWMGERPPKLPKPKDKTSKHILSTTELTCLAPIKEGFISALDTRSYATRLRVVMRTLHTLRVVARECKSVKPIVDIVDAIRSIHSFQFAIIAERHVLLAVTFAGAWEPYLRIIWKDLGPLMDLILCNCQDYVENSSDKGFERFVGWIRQVQIESDFFYPASGLSVDDHRYLAEVERKIRTHGGGTVDGEIAKHVVTDPATVTHASAKADPLEAAEQALLLLRVLDGLRDFYQEVDADHVFLERVAVQLLKDTNLRDQIKNAKEPLPRELAWIDKLLTEHDKQVAAVSTESQPSPTGATVRQRGVEDEIQGGILKPYKREVTPGRTLPATHGCLLLARVTDPKKARQFLRHWAKTCVTREAARGERRLNREADYVYTNIAFTFKGLTTLGVSESALEMFPKEFREGMEARAGLLGDVQSNHPERWELPEWNVNRPPTQIIPEIPRVRISTVDLLVQMRTIAPDAGNDWHTGHPLREAVEKFIDEAGRYGIKVLSRQLMQDHIDETGQSPKVRDHFGFIDGISQPTPELPGRDTLPLGELLLGYENARRDPAFPQPGTPEARNLTVRGSLLDNGTFLVIRKLEQHVDVFDDFVSAQKGFAEDVLAKMMGRRRDGRALPDKTATTGNDFDFTQDPDGIRCPFQAHIRRGNPRAAVNGMEPPRIMRRGMSYGPEGPEPERGLMFMAYNASIAEQFEVIQHWMTGGNSTGIFSGQRDPFIGVPDPNESRTFRFHDVNDQLQRVDLPTEALVTLKWGMYLFVPSIAALDALTADPPSEPDRAVMLERVNAGQAIIDRLQTATEWATVYEDVTPIHAGTTALVSAAIRVMHGGVRRTPYGVIVASEPLVMRVLRDDEVFSVVEYRNRMERSIGQIYLGLDAGEEYERQSRQPNAAIQMIRAEDAFEQAWKSTIITLLSGVGIEQQRRQAANGGDTDPVLFSVEQLADLTLAKLSQHWFDIPDGDTVLMGGRPAAGDTAPRCPFHTVAPSRYIFSSPQPRRAVVGLGSKFGGELLQGVKKFVAKHRGARRSELRGELSQALFASFGHDEDALASNLAGLLEGFLPTVYGNFLKVVYLWQSDETLWRLQQDLCSGAEADYHHATRVLERPLHEALMKRPIPDVLYRTAMKDVDLGGVRVNAGERVVVSLASATQELLSRGTISVAPVFGGMRSQKDHPTHACPGYEMGIGVLLGMITALLQAGSLRPAPYPFMQLGDPKPFYDPKPFSPMPKGAGA